jgi:ATP-dependent Lhr-like helicase
VSTSKSLSLSVGRAFFGTFASLREVQKRSIEPLLDGRDTLIRAATASGKTEAAIAPLIDRYLDRLVTADGQVRIVVVSPTRALVNDLWRRLEPPLAALGIAVGVRHGERNHLQNSQPPAVIITTPESFDVEVGRHPKAYAGVLAVVLDEAHLLYNTQRGMQVAICIERLQLWLERRLQVVALSATIGEAKEVWAFFRPGTQIAEVAVSEQRPLDYRIRLDVTIDELVQLLERVADQKVLVFVSSRRMCDAVVDALRRHRRDHVWAHHSSLSRDSRETAEEEFERATAGVCVATSTLELGIDIGAIDLVVLYGVPADWQSLVQRVGRGNRRADCVQALLLVPDGDRDSLFSNFGFQALLLQSQTSELIAGRAQDMYGAVAQQLASWLVAEGRHRGANTLVKPFGPWRHLDPDTVYAIADELVQHEVLQRHPAYHRYGPDAGAYALERTWELWSNFAGGGRELRVSNAGRDVGRISGGDAERMRPGDVFLLGGRRWRVEGTSGFDVFVGSTNAAPTVQLRYASNKPEPGPLLAEAIRRTIVCGDPAAHVQPASSRDLIQSLCDDLAPLAGDGALSHAEFDGRHVYVTFAGSRLNRWIAEWSGDARADVNEFVLCTGCAIAWHTLPTRVGDLRGAASTSPTTQTRFQRWLPADLQAREANSVQLSPIGYEAVLRRLRSAMLRPIRVDQLAPFGWPERQR